MTILYIINVITFVGSTPVGVCDNWPSALLARKHDLSSGKDKEPENRDKTRYT